MHTEIKKLADEALALQNKDRMDAALREISALCEQAGVGVGDEQATDAGSTQLLDMNKQAEVSE